MEETIIITVSSHFCLASLFILLDSSNSYRRGHSSHSHSSSSRPLSVEAALKTDRILSFDQFSSIERAQGEELMRLYCEYLQKHQHAYLHSFFNKHKKEKWIQRRDTTEHPGKFEWNQEASLLFTEEYGFKRDQESDSSADPVYFAALDAPLPSTLAPLLPLLAKQVITLSNIPAYLDRESILAFVKEELESEIVSFDLSAPNPEKNLYRLGWLQCQESESSDLLAKLEAKGSIEGAKIYFGLSSSKVRRFKVATTAEKDEDALKTAANLIAVLDGISDEESAQKFSCLDEAVFYLRSVHHFCFYCGQAFSCASELRNKCGDLHLRRAGESERGYNERVAAFTVFFKTLKTLASQTDSSPEAVDAYLSEQSIAKVEEEKYRCSHCSKAFKGPEFVLKHLHLKHEDIVAGVKDELKLFNEFLSHASQFLFPSSMIPRYLSLKAKLPSSRESSKSSVSSRRGALDYKDYKDWDAFQPASTELNYDLDE